MSPRATRSWRLAPLSGRRHRRGLWLAAWALATVCLGLFLRTLDLADIWTQLQTASPAWLLIAVTANFAALPLLTEQWVRLLPRGRTVRWRTLWECVVFGLGAMNTLPFGGGHAVAVGLLATRGGIGLDGGVSLLALEQLCDGFAKLALLLAALALAPLPLVFHRIAWILTAVMIIGTAALWWLAHHPPAKRGAGGWRQRFGRYLEVLKRPRDFLFAVALSLAIRLTAILALYATQRSFGLDLPLSAPVVVLAAVTFTTLVSVTPVNLGVYEATTFHVYRLLGVSPAQSAALGIVQHACLLLSFVAPAYLLVLWRVIAERPTPANPRPSVELQREEGVR